MTTPKVTVCVLVSLKDNFVIVNSQKCHVVKKLLLNKIISRRGDILWPNRMPYLALSDCYLKSRVY